MDPDSTKHFCGKIDWSVLNERSWITSRRVISFHVFQNLEKVIILAFFPYFSRFSKFESLFIWIHSFNMTPRGITWCHVIAFERLRAHFDFYPPWNKNEWISESKHLIYQNQLQDISWSVSWSRNVHKRDTFNEFSNDDVAIKIGSHVKSRTKYSCHWSSTWWLFHRSHNDRVSHESDCRTNFVAVFM